MPLDLGRVTHLLEQMHRSEDDAGDPIVVDKVLVTDGAAGFTWEDYAPSTAIALDDLTDVTITAPAADDTLSYNGSIWVNSGKRWEPVTDGEDVFVWESDDLVMEWKEY